MLLNLGDNLHINIGPVVAKGEGLRFTILGKSGSGKTHHMFVLAEEVLKLGWPVLVIDPMNNFRHLRQLPHAVVVAGHRKSADVNLTLDNAPVLAEWFFRERISLVIDSSMYPDDTANDVVAAFLRQFWRLVLEQDEDAELPPYVILIDEAHEFVPQGISTAASALLKDIGKRGRQLNIWMMAATQRAASIDKNFLTQVNAILSHKVMLGLDAQIVAEAVNLPQKVVNSLMRKLHIGEVIAIADMELMDFGDEDYLVAKVRPTVVRYSRQKSTAETAEAAPVRTIEPAMIATLREAMTEATPPPDPLPVYGEGELTATITRQAARIRELEAEVKRLREGVQTEMAIDIPHSPPTPATSLAAATQGGAQRAFAANGHDEPGAADWDGRSELATARAINKQQRDFNSLLLTLKDHSVMHRRILVYLTRREGQAFIERDLARFTGYALGTLEKRRPTGMERLGLIRRRLTNSRHDWEYQSTVRAKLAEMCPDLDTEALVSTISKLEKM